LDKRAKNRYRNFSRFGILAVAVMGTLIGMRAMNRSSKRISFSGKSVVITGGSRGLGLVIARLLAEEGARLSLMAKDEEDLNRAAGELESRGAEVFALACDIRNQSQVNEAINKVVRHFGGIDVLINNAGIIQVGPLENMDLDDFKEAMEVHFWGPLYTTLAALGPMRRAGSGRVVNIASIGGQVAVPHLTPYTASKFALVGLSDGLRAELAQEGIYVTTVSPGLMRTGSHVNAFFKGQHQKEYAWFSISSALPVTSINAQSAARQIIEACRYAKPELVITPQARFLILFNRLAPGWFATLSKFANWLLPKYLPDRGDQIQTGLESQSRWSPSILTRLNDLAALKNNQVNRSENFLVDG
jgi:NAD(P)-dependent dehydrogenase (short-subunit alcohol dehydrogenase family)